MSTTLKMRQARFLCTELKGKCSYALVEWVTHTHSTSSYEYISQEAIDTYDHLVCSECEAHATLDTFAADLMVNSTLKSESLRRIYSLLRAWGALKNQESVVDVRNIKV